jgi:hypothetical protein
MGKAGRTDAYGNKQRYNSATNEWETDLTDTQENLVKAGEQEQLKSLTEDAMRNRDIKKRAVSRGLEAGQDYSKTLSEFKNTAPASEDAIKGELTQLLAGVTESKGRKGNAEAIRQSIRQGGKGNTIPALIRASDEDMGGELAENLLKARTGAVAEKAGRETAHSAKYIPRLTQLAQLMDMGGDAPARFSETPASQVQQQGSQASAMLQALTAGGNLTNAANTAAAKTYMAGGPDLRGLAAMMNSGRGFTNNNQTTDTPTRAQQSANDYLPIGSSRSTFDWNADPSGEMDEPPPAEDDPSEAMPPQSPDEAMLAMVSDSMAPTDISAAKRTKSPPQMIDSYRNTTTDVPRYGSKLWQGARDGIPTQRDWKVLRQQGGDAMYDDFTKTFPNYVDQLDQLEGGPGMAQSEGDYATDEDTYKKIYKNRKTKIDER